MNSIGSETKPSPLKDLILSLFVLGLIALCFFALEYFCHQQLQEKMPYKYEKEEPLFDVNEQELIIPTPNKRIRVWAEDIETNESIYDVFYTMDSFSRRITPITQPLTRKKHLLFFGGSFTFGQGVEDPETLPARVGALSSEYMPYNYAFLAFGAAEMLARFEKTNVAAEVPEKEGLLIYVFIDNHINRAIGTLQQSRFANFQHDYQLGSNGELERQGFFAKTHPLRTRIYGYLYSLAITRYFNFEHPKIKPKHIQHVVNIIGKSKQLYLEQFPKGSFYVAIYPNSIHASQLIDYLEAQGIDYLDYSRMDFSGLKYKLAPKDNHPSALAHQVLAEKMTQNLQAKK